MNSHAIAVAELLQSEGSEFEMKIHGDCMAPALKSGERVRVVAGDRYLPGDIIVFRENQGRLVAHRLLGGALTGSGWRYMTKPDRSERIDGLYERGRVLGKLVANISRQSEIRITPVRRLQCICLLLRESLILGWRKLNR